MPLSMQPVKLLATTHINAQDRPLTFKIAMFASWPTMPGTYS